MLTKEMLSYIAENIEDIKRIIRDLHLRSNCRVSWLSGIRVKRLKNSSLSV